MSKKINKKAFITSIAIATTLQGCGFKSVLEKQGCEASGMTASEAYDNRANSKDYLKNYIDLGNSPDATKTDKRIADTIRYGLYEATSRSEAYQKGWSMCMDSHDYFK